ncbi:WecB/TagA/CpsF family glycosyltransferase [Emcibacter sp. SYSU 3D8]|uniref:WecB/TagA/CpsF family glycosyltransferase n=1 Tax=Emcibacter sp. SYSU 3D8 TaxID=3133969 RepID=UPI0031FE4D08
MAPTRTTTADPIKRRSVRHIVIGGVPTAVLGSQGLADRMVADCLAHRAQPDRWPTMVFSTNGHTLSMAAVNRRFRDNLLKADIIHADGGVIVAASRFTDANIPERTATTDFIHQAGQSAVDAGGLRFFLLGSPEDINRAAGERLEALYPHVTIVGQHHGYFKPEDEAEICDLINSSGADVVWVGLGKPLEQEFCVRNRSRIRAGWIITCGGCFHYLTGDYRRAPVWMQRWGLEWLHRMVFGPSYLIARYLTTNPHAIYLIATRTRRKPE